ncbi:MAG: transglycosylase domain-containing protein [Rhodospirillales bacterium]|nr:transglycosylase domain-containing protein [Rhodospirillales bacterium]
MMIRLVTALGSALMLFIVLVVAGGVLLYYRYSRDLPDIEQLATYEPPVTTRVYTGDGRLLAEYATEKRVFVPIASIPPHLVQAFLAAEDKNFYEHQGIDANGVIRAVITNINNLGSDRRLVGASTIPQQVAKNFLLSGDVTFERKIKEAILAFRMDKALSKDRILELYLNEIYLGGGSCGWPRRRELLRQRAWKISLWRNRRPWRHCRRLPTITIRSGSRQRRKRGATG